MSSETQTPPQTPYDMGRDLANHANELFDARLGAAAELAQNIGDTAAENNFETADAQFNRYVAAGGALLNASGVTFESTPTDSPQTSETSKDDHSFVSPELWSSMSEQERAFATEARDAIAHSNLREYGVTADSLRVVMARKIHGRDTLAIVHVGEGVDIGDHAQETDPARNYRSIMSADNDSLFKVTIGSREYDSRKGMTKAAYEAIESDVDQANTLTVLTGELIDNDNVAVRGHNTEGAMTNRTVYAGTGRVELRVRPAIEFPIMSA